MRKIIIGLFSPMNVDLTATFNALCTLGEVRLITVGQTSLGPIDMLVYPDGMGIIPTIGALYHNNRAFIPSKPVNSHFYLFWNENSVERLTEERNIPILGIGQAAVMLYDIIGGLAIIDVHGNEKMLPIKNKEVFVKEVDGLVTSFEKDLLFGANNIGSAIWLLKSIKRKIEILDEDDNNDEVDDDTPKRVTPPRIPKGE